MDNSMRLAPLALLFGAAAVTVGIACGPDFPWQLLDDRAETLKQTPVSSFAFEAARFIFRPTDFMAVKEIEPSTSSEPEVEAYEAERIEAEKSELPTEVVATLAIMRQQADANRAYARGAGVPEAVRLYTAGAVAFVRSE